jgi:hypothetical protein
VQASIRNRLITKPFNLLFEMQYTTLEIADHWIIGRAMQQSSINLLLEHLLSSFKIEYVIQFCHDDPQNSFMRLFKKERALYGTMKGSPRRRTSSRYPKAPAHLKHRRSPSPQYVSPMLAKIKTYHC